MARTNRQAAARIMHGSLTTLIEDVQAGSNDEIKDLAKSAKGTKQIQETTIESIGVEMEKVAKPFLERLANIGKLN